MWLIQCEAQNSLESGNFRVLLRYVIHALPFCCRIDKMTPEEFDAHHAAPASGSSSSSSLDSAAEKKKTVEGYIAQAVNALFLVRNFTMRFIEKQDECPLLAHFNRQVPVEDWTTIVSPRSTYFAFYFPVRLQSLVLTEINVGMLLTIQ